MVTDIYIESRAIEKLKELKLYEDYSSEIERMKKIVEHHKKVKSPALSKS